MLTKAGKARRGVLAGKVEENSLPPGVQSPLSADRAQAARLPGERGEYGVAGWQDGARLRSPRSDRRGEKTIPLGRATGQAEHGAGFLPAELGTGQHATDGGLSGGAGKTRGARNRGRGYQRRFHHEHHGLGTPDRPTRLPSLQRFLAARRSQSQVWRAARGGA